MNWRNWVKSLLLKRNTVLSKPPGQFSITEFKLERICQRGLEIRVAVDAGAARGDFTECLKQVYPNASVVLIEPRQDVQPQLAALAARLPGLTVVSKLVGPHVGEVEYCEDTDRSSILKDHDGKVFGHATRAPMTTLDQLMDDLKLVPDFIKLDVQGAELEVLAGGQKSLATANSVLMEASFLEFQQGTPLFAEVIRFMSDHDFRLYDILGLWHRPLDGALAQGDFFFLKNGHPLLQDKRWRTESQAFNAQ